MGKVVELVLGEERLHQRELGGRDVGEDEVLVGGETEEALVDLGDLAETGLELELGLVLDSTVLSEKEKKKGQRECEDASRKQGGGGRTSMNIVKW